MAYQFTAGESVATNARRVAVECLEDGVRLIDDSEIDSVATVHEVRKHCKKLRALIRLVVPDPASDMVSEIHAFRNVSRSISRVREAHIWIFVLDSLDASFPGRLNEVVLTHARERLRERTRYVEKREVELDRVLENVRREFDAGLSRARAWQLRTPTGTSLAGSLLNSHRRAVASAWKAWRKSSERRLHNWRKDAKTHWYHASLLEPIDPESLSSHTVCLDVLADTLGAERDLFTLHEGLAEVGIEADPRPGTGDLFAVVDERRDDLRREAERMMRPVLRWKPGHAVQRIHECYP